jgi:sulfur carrier protein
MYYLSCLLRRNMLHKSLVALYYSGNMIEFTVNGATERCDRPLAISELLERKALTGRRIAVERNGEIVPRGAHASTLLADGDRLEIVVAVGGG